jgi:ankyrin repeat protein
VLAASFIHHKLQKQVPVLYFFFRQIVEANHKPRAALQDWLAQALVYSPPLQLQLRAYLADSEQESKKEGSSQPRELDSVSTIDLWQHLRTALSHLNRAYIVVDALDEMHQSPATDEFMSHLLDLASWKPAQIKILVTSRPTVSLEQTRSDEDVLYLKLDEGNVDKDIGAYIVFRLASSAIPTELHGAIQAAVPGRANGLFLYAKLAMDTLLREGIDVRPALLEIPQNLDHMYAKLLQNHRARSGVSLRLQELIMRWVTHAIRPLRLIELSDMLTDDPTFDHPALGAAKHSVRSASGNLIELLRDETLCVIHHSFTEYLIGDRRLDTGAFPKLEPGPTHQRLALICLEYLQNGCLEDFKLEAPSRPGRGLKAPSKHLLRPFTRYAALNWNIHVKRSVEHCMPQTEVNNLLDRFTGHTHFQNWAYLVGLHRGSALIITPVFMATVLGLSAYLRHLLRQPDIDLNEGAPIAWAADQGYTDVVDLLIAHGADVNQYDTEGYTALHRATMKNHVGVVRSLLQASGDMRKDTQLRGFQRTQYTSIWYACNYGHVDALIELQKFMKSRNEVRQALFTAVHSKKAEMVRALLTHPLVDLNNKSMELSSRQQSMAAIGIVSHAAIRNMQPTFLGTACLSRDASMIGLLLDAGAEVGPNALHDVARSRQETDPANLVRCFSLLIEAGADVHAPGSGNALNTALHEAADAMAARALINAGANVEAMNRERQTPLHTCVNVEISKTLVKVGNANLEAKDSHGKTVLLAAIQTKTRVSQRKILPAILELIELGADIDAVDEDGNGVFHHAVIGHGRLLDVLEELIPRLCAAGADINRANHRGEAPIHLTKLVVSKSAFLDGLGKVRRSMTPFEILAAAGARSDTANVSKTPLFEWVRASIMGAKDADLAETAQALAQYGTSLQVTDDQGRTLLHSAVQKRQFTDINAKLRFLVDQGLDPGITDNEGNTFWHVAASNLHKHGFFDFLATLDVEGASKPNQLGQTPLHLIAARMPDSLWEFDPLCGRNSDPKTPFHIVLSLHSHVDVADNNGITPLHLVATFSEYLVQMLLLRGAKPSLVTKEGCNAFHLAARSRKPNIIGAMLASMQSITADTRLSTLNSKDNFGRTPLYYACLAGCYKSSKMLVEAGATFQTTEYENSPWAGIAEIELEATTAINHSKKTCIGTALMADVSRVPDKWKLYGWDVGIEGLINLLLTDPNSRQSFLIDQAITDAARNQADYTVDCLVKARAALQLEKSLPLTTHITVSLQRQKDKRESLDKPCIKCERTHNKSLLSRAWAMRDYDRIPEILLSEGKLHSLSGFKDDRFILRSMVSDGLIGPLQLLMTAGGPETLSDHLWNSTEAKKTSPNFGRNNDRSEVEPLILTACRRVAPNMEVLRFLVEEAGHDVNAQELVKASSSTEPRRFDDRGKNVEGESALHALTRSEHWWHTYEGLPYLLQQGASTEVRDIHGMTPLNAALHRCGWLVFNRKAVELLIQHGADVNAVDGDGNSCLAKACFDTEVTTLLLRNGAKVTQSSLIRAIELKSIELLALLLSHATDADLSETPRKQEDRRQPQEYYPLHYIVMTMSYRAFERSATDDEGAQKMIGMLLDHGADPCASYGDTTILHELINNHDDPSPLFATLGQRINLEVINSAGETPLLAAFSRNRATRGTKRNPEDESAISLLLRNGADIRAKDCNGDNIWHHFARELNRGQETEDWQGLIQKAPDLINTPNNAGENPLLLAMKDINRSSNIELLIENGASLHTVDNDGNNVLHVLMNGRWVVEAHGSVSENRLSYFKRFIESGVPINARNEAGETPIFNFFRQSPVIYGPCKCEKGKGQSIYDIFTSAGCDWQVVNDKGQNLLHIVAGATPPVNYHGSRSHAEYSDTSAIFLKLVEMGLDAKLEDASGRTALDVAADMGHEKILEYFREKGSDDQVDY